MHLLLIFIDSIGSSPFPSHRSHVKFTRRGQRGQWPANSPDLSPIDYVWAILKNAVLAREPKNETLVTHRVHTRGMVEHTSILYIIIQWLYDTITTPCPLAWRDLCIATDGGRFKAVHKTKK